MAKHWEAIFHPFRAFRAFRASVLSVLSVDFGFLWTMFHVKPTHSPCGGTLSFDTDEMIILDRDGVINEDSTPTSNPRTNGRPIPGSLEAIARLNHAGYRVVVATNQSGIGRGLFDLETLNRITRRCTGWRRKSAV